MIRDFFGLRLCEKKRSRPLKLIYLTEIGEPYRFGMSGDEMKVWLEEKGFQAIEILQQDDLEEQFLHRRTLPNNMWYVAIART